MPSSVADARDLMISSVLCPDPVVYIDDRWLYEQEDYLPPVEELDLKSIHPLKTQNGDDITIIASGHASFLAREAAKELISENYSVEVIDIRVLNPFDIDLIVQSVVKTKRFLVVDSGWLSSGFSAEVFSKTIEHIPLNTLLSPPKRIALPDAPAPTSKVLEKTYYTSVYEIVEKTKNIINN